MIAALGYAAVITGLAACVCGVAMSAVAARTRDRRFIFAARQMVPTAFAAALAAVLAMEVALVSRDFSIAYVAENGSRSTPLLYTVASLWGALEGSILLWALVLSGYLLTMTRWLRSRADDPVAIWSTLVGLAVATFFFGLMAGPANPFEHVRGSVPLDGPGPNPLLQNHPLMAFHPPLLYLGYVGFTIPFAVALAVLIVGRADERWLHATRRWTLVAWGCLTAGIILGGWWSYEVLGWGGYWAWDPVENASLLPWLVGTAYLHSVIVEERRGMLRVWNLSLVTATFCLTILGTFLTRAGVITSVHAFSQSSVGPLLLGFLGVSMAASIGLVAWRSNSLRVPARIDSPWSREAAFLANNVLFGVFAAVVLIGTVFPLLAEAFDGRQVSVGEPYFDDMTRPVGFALLFLMAVAPALPWRAATAATLHIRLVRPALGGAAAMVVAVAAGSRGFTPTLTWGLAAFALSGIVQQTATAVKRARRSGACGRLSTLWKVANSDRRLYGGLVVHIGVVLFAVSFSMSSSFSTRREVRLAEGDRVAFAGFTIAYEGVVRATTDAKRTTKARLRIDGSDVYEPALSVYPSMPQAIGTPSVKTGIARDLYLTLITTPRGPGDAAVIGLQSNPLVLWLWVSGAVMTAGTAFAAWPRHRPRTRVRRRGELKTAQRPASTDQDEPVAAGFLA